MKIVQVITRLILGGAQENTLITCKLLAERGHDVTLITGPALVEGDGFLYNMVRNIVGSLAEVGLGRWTPDRIGEALAAQDRRAAGPIAPPNGLCLMWIRY